MFPIRDAVPAPTRPLATLALVAAGSAVTLLVGLISIGHTDASLIADAGSRGESASSTAWLWTTLSLVRPSGWLQGVACAAALWIFGPTVEDRLGHGRFLGLFIGCAVAGAAAVALVGGVAPTAIGLLPGAVGGVVGAHAALYPRARTLVLVPASHGLDVDTVPAALLAGFWIVAQVASSIVPGTEWPAWTPRLALLQLTVGIVTGGVAAYLLRRPERMRVEWWNR